MQPHESFKAEYNKGNLGLVDIKMHLLGQDLKIWDANDGVCATEADNFETQAAADQEVIMAKVWQKVLCKQWMISQDKLELYNSCSCLLCGDKHTMAVAMLQDYMEKSRDAAFNKHQTLVEGHLKVEQELD